jgi:hypothetical protein
MAWGSGQTLFTRKKVVRAIGLCRKLEPFDIMMTQCQAASGVRQVWLPGAAGSKEHAVVLRGGGCLGAWMRGVAIATAVSAGGCSMTPDFSEFRLPNKNTFVPTSTAAYVGPVSQSGPVNPSDLVDGQGSCAGQAQAQGSPEASAAGGRSVGLEMTECDVVRTLGPPQSANVGTENGTRTAVLTYRSGDRPGVYQFFGGRLKSIDQGDEPAPAPVAKPAKKPKTQQGA